MVLESMLTILQAAHRCKTKTLAGRNNNQKNMSQIHMHITEMALLFKVILGR